MNAFIAVVRIVTVGALVTIADPVAAQQNYPNKPIRFITPYAAGGSTSFLARIVGQKLTESWGQQVLVESRGGGNTIIATELLAKSPPDGYTILMVSPAIVVNASLYRKLPYDSIKDFAAVATLTSYEHFLVVHPSLPANNLHELIALAKSKPGQLNYASSGILMQLQSEQFNILAGTQIQNIPYKGGGPAVADLLGGQVHMTFAVPPNVIGHVKNGRLRGIAVSGQTRMSALPEVPTFTEAGLPGYDVSSWYGIIAPAGTSKEIIDKLSAEIARILALPDVKEKLDSQGFQPFVSTPAAFSALMKADMAKYAKIIKIANIKIED